MKVLLINPPAQNELQGNNPEIIDSERGFNPPLGLLYVASYALKHSNCQVAVLDCPVEGVDHNNLPDRIKTIAPDIVGIEAMTFTLLDVLETIKIVKQVQPQATIVLGGPHVHIYPEETMALPGVDFLVMGEGEVPFTELLKVLAQDKVLTPEQKTARLLQIKGLTFKNHLGQIVSTGIRDLTADLDSLPFPDRRLTPYQKYTSIISSRSPITTLISSRGCPYRCSFCDRPHLGKKFRARSPENVVAEAQECRDLGIKEILIYDDTFTVDRQRVIDICRLLIERKLDLTWDIRARVDTVDEEILDWLKRAGCQRIHYGVEAGTAETLKVLQKGITLDKVRRAFALTKKAGIDTLAYFMIGSPGEDEKMIRQTIKFACQLDPDYVHATILTPFPHTQIYSWGLERGIFKTDHWREFARQPRADFQPKFWEETLSEEKLRQLIGEFYRSFYLRPGYILKRLTRIRSARELVKKAKAGLKVFSFRD